MIKIANSIEEYKKCLEFLEKFNYKPLKYSILFYAEDKGEIICVAGYHRDWGSMIEPMYSEESLRGVRAGEAMYRFMESFLRNIGHLIIRFKTENQNLVKLMKKHYDFKKEEPLTYMAKEL